MTQALPNYVASRKEKKDNAPIEEIHRPHNNSQHSASSLCMESCDDQKMIGVSHLLPAHNNPDKEVEKAIDSELPRSSSEPPLTEEEKPSAVNLKEIKVVKQNSKVEKSQHSVASIPPFRKPVDDSQLSQPHLKKAATRKTLDSRTQAPVKLTSVQTSISPNKTDDRQVVSMREEPAYHSQYATAVSLAGLITAASYLGYSGAFDSNMCSALFLSIGAAGFGYAVGSSMDECVKEESANYSFS